MEFPVFIQQILMLFAPQPCYDEIFVKLNFFDVPCLKVVASKTVSILIILGAILVKVPQIMKIKKAQSSEGISILSVMLEILAITGNVSYSFGSGYPFTSYGDGAFLLIQTVVIAVMALIYSGRKTVSLAFLSVYCAVLAFLLSPAVPPNVLWFLMTCNVPVIIFARMLQAFSNFQNGHTGQLSAIMVFLLFSGAFARILTSMQETGDPTIIITYCVATTCNGILASQMVYYWNVRPGDKNKKRQ